MTSATKATLKTIDDVSPDLFKGKRVLMRVDFNVPQHADGTVSDDTRMQEALPTIRDLLGKGACLILVSHLGRPKGVADPKFSMAPVTGHLQTLLPGVSVAQAGAVVGPDVAAAVDALKPGSVLVLENVRFEAGEEKNDPTLSDQLAALADVYVNDAFGAAHRAHASTAGVADRVPVRLAGLLMAREVKALSAVLTQPDHPFTAIIGGSKISSKITVLKSLLEKVDTLIVGGGMMFTFLKAMNLEVGESLVEADYVELARELLAEARTRDVNLMLPGDVVVARAFSADAEHQTVPVNAIEKGWMGLDIGPKSIAAVEETLRQSKTVLWNGPLGVFEFDAFAGGTEAVARTLATVTQEGGCESILGGGDTVAAIEKFHIPHDQFTHVSTGGGASLEFLEGKTLPGIAALTH
ncbi:MAG: phosphoglycerate kinase [Candidatus Melainabacteria bacterium]